MQGEEIRSPLFFSHFVSPSFSPVYHVLSSVSVFLGDLPLHPFVRYGVCCVLNHGVSELGFVSFLSVLVVVFVGEGFFGAAV